MHGSSFSGDGGDQLRRLAAYDEAALIPARASSGRPGALAVSLRGANRRSGVGIGEPIPVRRRPSGYNRAVAPQRQVIDVHLNAPREMFELPPTDLFTEFRNYLTGIDHCLSELRSRWSRRPVTVRVHLPEDQIAEDTAERIGRTMRAYCDQRRTYNHRERRALRLDGLTALRIGVPITVVGLIMTVEATYLNQTSEEVLRTILDHLGWVFAWLGLWFPLDMFFFYPHAFARESRALELLRNAEVEIGTASPDLVY